MRHSVVLDFKKCRGCTTCIKNCPTEAIRVRSGKATILPNRCIDCGTCIRVCPHKAVKSVCDDFSALKNYRYTIAIPDPALYGQFQNLDDVDIVLNGLLELGFDLASRRMLFGQPSRCHCLKTEHRLPPP